MKKERIGRILAQVESIKEEIESQENYFTNFDLIEHLDAAIILLEKDYEKGVEYIRWPKRRIIKYHYTKG